MKRPSPLLLLLTVCCAAVLPACAQAPIPHAVRIGSIEELQAYFTYDPGRDIIVSGHRGGMMPGYPENCIESCEKTLSMMPTFFEVDFSFTRDSVMVLMHDLTIDRTTTGKGRVADYTYAELQQFCLVDRDRNVTPYKIPRLKDLLEWGKDKVVFNFDNKYINTRGVSDEVRRASLDYYIKQLQPGGDWSMYHNIMLSVRSVEEALYYWEHGIRNVMFCVEISSMEHFRAYDASPIPWKYIMAYIRLAVNPDLQPVYDLLHAEGVMTMTSITGSSDKVKNPYDRRVAYLRELVAEPDIIETDYPSEFIGLPWSRDAIHALQEAAMRRLARSSLVRVGMGTDRPGAAMLLRLCRTPPRSTVQTSASGPAAVTSTSSLPSSSRSCCPGRAACTSWTGQGMPPAPSCTVPPSGRVTGLASRPTRSSGPCRSMSRSGMPTAWIIASQSVCSASAPWERFMRRPVMPASTRRRRVPALAQAGPMVP